MTLHTVGAVFDEHRNTSRVFQPSPTAVADALKALQQGRSQHWYLWVVAYGQREHAHDLLTRDGKRAACPVRGCKEGT